MSCVTFYNMLFPFLVRRCYPPPNPQAGGPPPVSCSLLLIQYIRSFPLYVEAFSIRNLRVRHVMVTRDRLKMALNYVSQRKMLQIQGEHKRTLHIKNYTENKCSVLRTSHLHQSIEKFS
jgi:hypothetical protein